jgi:hypothetical protein
MFLHARLGSRTYRTAMSGHRQGGWSGAHMGPSLHSENGGGLQGQRCRCSWVDPEGFGPCKSSLVRWSVDGYIGTLSGERFGGRSMICVYEGKGQWVAPLRDLGSGFAWRRASEQPSLPRASSKPIASKPIGSRLPWTCWVNPIPYGILPLVLGQRQPTSHHTPAAAPPPPVPWLLSFVSNCSQAGAFEQPVDPFRWVMDLA